MSLTYSVVAHWLHCSSHFWRRSPCLAVPSCQKWQTLSSATESLLQHHGALVPLQQLFLEEKPLQPSIVADNNKQQVTINWHTKQWHQAFWQHALQHQAVVKSE